MTDDEISVHYKKLVEWAINVHQIDEVTIMLFEFISITFTGLLRKMNDDDCGIELIEASRKHMLDGIMELHNIVEIFDRDKSKDN
jgi:hypothetical protein